MQTDWGCDCYALVTVLTLLVPASAQVLDFTTIDVPGASFTLPRGINPEGDIVGFYGVAGSHSCLPASREYLHRHRCPWGLGHPAPQYQPSG